MHLAPGRVKRIGGFQAQIEEAGSGVRDVVRVRIPTCGGGFGQVGYQGIQPIIHLTDDLFGPSPVSPYGQHWLHTTKVTYAWTLVGYNQPWAVDHNNPNRTIAIIDTGIDMDHPEFGGDGALPWKLHPASATLVEGGAHLHDIVCTCAPSIYPPPDPENGPTDVQDNIWIGGYNPHGTVEAGLAGAYAQNSEGIAGVCWDCSLLVLRVAPRSRPPEDCHGCQPSDSSVAACIRYAAGWFPGLNEDDDSQWDPVRARVICTAIEGIVNFGNEDPSFCDAENPLNKAIDLAHARGCVIVAIMGNDTSNCWGFDNGPEPDDPTCTPMQGFAGTDCSLPLAWHPKTIAVGGACRTGLAWHCHSAVNPPLEDLGTCGYAYYPDPPGDGTAPILSVVAPIEDVISTFVYDTTQNPPGALYGFINEDSAGTSWASPQVAGLVALMLGVNSSLTFDQVKHILQVTATDIDDPGYDKRTGWGLINARAAIEYVMKQQLPGDWNGDGAVETIDAAQYIIDYSNADVMTDLNLDTAQTTDDMTIFLNSYAGE